jgi:hypothetical protein
MRNRIKGFWSWEDVGILPEKLAHPRGAKTRRVPVKSGSKARDRTGFALAGGILAGFALLWLARSVFKRV